MSTFVVTVQQVGKTGQGHVIFTCHGASTQDHAVGMVKKYIEDVRAGRKTPVALGDYWGSPADPVPRFIERENTSEDEVFLKWSVDGSLKPGGLRCGANILIDLY